MCLRRYAEKRGAVRHEGRIANVTQDLASGLVTGVTLPCFRYDGRASPLFTKAIAQPWPISGAILPFPRTLVCHCGETALRPPFVIDKSCNRGR